MSALISQDRLDRFFQTFLKKIHQWDENVDRYRDRFAILRAVPLRTILRIMRAGPEILHLLISLVNHDEISKETKSRISAALAYFIFPFDILPEGIIGPIGYFDDLVIALMLVDYLLNGENEAEKAIINEVWQGEPGELETLRTMVRGINILRYVGNKVRKIFS